MREVLDYYAEDIENSTILEDSDLTAGQYFLVSSHREENVDVSENLLALLQILNRLADLYLLPIIFQHIRGLKTT